MILSMRPVDDWFDRRQAKSDAKKAARYKWHFWFAWHPKIIQINRGDNNGRMDPHLAWLSTIARRYDSSYMRWQYGPITNVVTQP